MTKEEAQRVLENNDHAKLVVLDVEDCDIVARRCFGEQNDFYIVSLIVGWVHDGNVFKGRIVVEDVEAVSLDSIPIIPKPMNPMTTKDR